MNQFVTQEFTTIRLLNMPLAQLDQAGCNALVLRRLAAGRGGWIVTANLDILRRYVFDAAFRHLVRHANVVVADGMPLVWASLLQGTPLPERVAGSDLISSLSAGAARAGRSVFLLGGDAGTAERAALALRAACPGLHVCGTWYPPLGFEHDPAHMAAMRLALRKAAPDIVYVALGCPKQERLISLLRWDFPSVWWIGVGISFSFLAGEVRRAPRWLQRAGLEWSSRLWQEPRRLGQRYLVHCLPFALVLLTSAVLARLRASLAR